MARTPLYKATENAMIDRITSGTWEVGRRLPNEFELADEFGVSQGTMRRALIRLEEMGFLSRKPGRGTLVAANQPRPTGVAPTDATAQILDAQGSPLDFQPFRARASRRLARHGEEALLRASQLAMVQRTLKISGTRAAMDEIVVPEAIVPRLDDMAPLDFRAFLEAHGLAPHRIAAEATAEITDMSQSVALSVDRHTALLCVTETAFDGDGSILALRYLQIAVPGARLVLS